MEPAVYEIPAIEADRLSRVVASLNAEAAPAVEVREQDGRTVFTCQTWRPILVTRVTDALDRES